MLLAGRVLGGDHLFVVDVGRGMSGISVRCNGVINLSRWFFLKRILVSDGDRSVR